MNANHPKSSKTIGNCWFGKLLVWAMQESLRAAQADGLTPTEAHTVWASMQKVMHEEAKSERAAKAWMNITSLLLSLHEE